MGRSIKTALLLLALLGCAALSPALAEDISDIDDDDRIDEEDEYEDVELDDSRAVLIAHKLISEETIIQGRNMTVKIVLHNVGKGSATNIHVNDGPIDQKLYKLVAGSPEGVIERINPGATGQHSYVLVPLRGDVKYFGPPASIKFSALIEAPPTQELLSTAAYAHVLTTAQSFQVLLLKMGKLLSLGVLKTSADWINSFAIIFVGAVLFGINHVVRWYTISRGDLKRAKARAELGAN